MKKLLLLLLCVVCSQLTNAKTVGPLIQTQWDQGYPYNLMCPEINGQHCMTSCGATAMAQLCYYYRWPEHGMGTGSWHLNEGNVVNWQYTDLTKDYYEYDKMLLTYDENSSEDSKKAVALLMRDVAYLGAVFGLNESSSPGAIALAELFGYDEGMRHLETGYYSQEDFESIIRSELDAGRPVLIDGSGGSGGHQFICDGYNDNGEFHFNYGWGGNSDGWSTLENCLFPLSMSLTFNIKKDEGGETGFTLCSNRDFKWVGGNKLYGNYKFDCWHMHLLLPQIALAVENTDTHEVQYLYVYDKDYSDINDVEIVWELDVDLPDGNYVLYPVGHGKEQNTQWQKCYFRDLCQREVALTVSGGVKTFTNASLDNTVRDGAIEVDGLCYVVDESSSTATLTYRNDKYASYSGDVVVPETITSNGKNYTVTAIGTDAFMECTLLDSVVIANTVTSIDMTAFVDAKAKKISFADGSQLKSVGGWSVYSGDYDEIILPEGLETIGQCAFANSNIKSITIPSSVSIWEDACFETTSLIAVHINSQTPPTIPRCFRGNVNEDDYADYNDWIPYGTQASVLYVPAGIRSAYEQTEVWKDFGFILEPDDDDSFVGKIKRDVVEIDGTYFQFNGLNSTARVVDAISDVENIVINDQLTMGPKQISVTYIREFAFEKCSSLKSITVNAVKPIEASSSAFAGVDMNSCILYVPQGCVDAYKSAPVWKRFSNILEIRSSSINSTLFDSDKTQDVYSLNGIKVRSNTTSLDGLPKGVYIINGKKVRK